MGEEKKDSAYGVGRIVNADTLVLLRKRDRFTIMVVALLVLLALATAAAIGGSAAAVVSVACMVIVAGLVGWLQWRAGSMRSLEAGLVLQGEAARAVNGDWWQVVREDDHPGLTYIGIAISEIAEHHALHGISFDSEGHRKARFSSDAIAVRTSTPVEMYYFWRGTILRPGKTEILSGFGRIRFDSVGHETRPLEAEGAYTRGTKTEFEFGDARAVELLRFTEEESRRLRKDPGCLSALAREAFVRLEIAAGRGFVVTERGEGSC
jgi:hypothetical protein